MTLEASIYYIACHFLYASLQVYYELYTAGSIVSNRSINWSSECNEIMSWTLEQLVFVFNHENTHTDKALMSEDFAEQHSDVVFARIFEAIADSSSNAQEEQPTRSNSQVYLFYCLTLLCILREFTKIITTSELASTVYFVEFAEVNGEFERLMQLLHGEIEIVSNVMATDLTQIESVSDQLGDYWSEAVYSAASRLNSIS
jgi:hypothetical protein